jgi:tripartite-type tricarboxylate transporter receptor subunit TctC
MAKGKSPGLRAAAALTMVFACVPIFSVAAQSVYPDHSIRLILPVTPGGGTDIVARLVGQKLSAALGQPVIVENHGGAGGNIAEAMVAHAKPDGYMLMVVTASHATNPSLFKNLPFDPLKDFAPIIQLTSQSYLFVVNPSVPATTVKQFVEYAQKNKGITFASSGTGMLSHLGMEQLKLMAHFEGLHVPYQGAGPALVATMAGQTQTFLPTVVSGLPFVRQGKLRVLAVTGAKRLALLPDVPTIAESGYPGYDVSGWYGMLTTAGTPKAVIDKLHDETVKVLNLPDVKAKIAADGAEPVGNTTAEFDAYLRSEVIKWGKVVKASGAHVE